MVKRTYGDLKSRLGRVASINGFKTTDERLIDRVNDAIEDIMESEDFPFIIDRMVFPWTGSNSLFVLPNNVDRIVNITIDDQAIFIRSPWYEYLDTSIGPFDPTTARDFIGLERGEVPTTYPIPTDGGPYVLKIKASGDETTTGVFHVRGLDENGDKVFDSGTEGLDIPFTAGSPFETVTTQRFSTITHIVKPETVGNVILYAQADPGGTDTELATYEPKDTTPSFRQYAFPTLANDDARTIIIRARKRFIPITTDNDPLIITNYQALKFMMIAHHKSDTQDVTGYNENYIMAKQKMWEASKSYRGKTKSPVMTAESGTGTGDFYAPI